MAAEELLEISRQVSSISSMTNNFRQMASQHNENISRILKDVHNVIFSQRNEVDRLNTSLATSISEMQSHAAKAASTSNSLLQQSLFIQQTMVVELREIQKALKGIGNLSGGGNSSGNSIGNSLVNGAVSKSLLSNASKIFGATAAGALFGGIAAKMSEEPSKTTPDATPSAEPSKTTPDATPSAQPSATNSNSQNITPTNGSYGAAEKNGSNGRLPDSSLASIGEGRLRAQPSAAEAYKAMKNAASGDRVNINSTDAYRTYEEQVDVKRRKPTLAATPGKSNHGWGLAFDIKTKEGDNTFKWMTENASRFGFKGPLRNPYEPWHWEYVGGGSNRNNQQQVAKGSNASNSAEGGATNNAPPAPSASAGATSSRSPEGAGGKDAVPTNVSEQPSGGNMGGVFGSLQGMLPSASGMLQRSPDILSRSLGMSFPQIGEHATLEQRNQYRDSVSNIMNQARQNASPQMQKEFERPSPQYQQQPYSAKSDVKADEHTREFFDNRMMSKFMDELIYTFNHDMSRIRT